MAATWSLSAEEREATVERIAKNISSIAFFKGLDISDADATAAAVTAEKKAYTAAQVAARTTTGNRPHAETTSGYARKLGELVLAAVTEGGKPQGAADAAANGAADVLDLTGSRDFLDAETARQVLAPLLAAGAAHKHVRFSTKSFGLEAAEVAAEALKAVAQSLTHADMSDIIAGRPEDEALQALRVISAALSTAQLKHLNLSDNALGEKGLRAAAAAFMPGLEFVSLQNVGCSVHACKALSELVPNSSALAGLHLYNNMTGDEGAEHVARLLSRCPGMADFKLASSRVGPAGGISVAKALSVGSNLIKLDLSDNPLTEEVASELAACLAKQPNLRHVNLNDTSLQDEGVEAVCKALAGTAPQLETLELALNEISPTGIRYVVMAIANKQKLSKLNLRENEFENEGAVTLSRGLATLPALQTVDLCCNQITRSGALAVARGLAKAKAGGAGAPLELLALDENGISEAGIEQLKQVLKDSFGSDSMLGPLDENDPDMASDEGEDVAEAVDEDDELTAALARTHI